MAEDNGKAKSIESAGPRYIMVGCKIALGYIDFEICEPTEVMQQTQTGPRPVTEWHRTGQKVRVRGTAYPRGQEPEGFQERPAMVLGYAITQNVRRDWWEQIAKQQARAEYFKSGMLIWGERIEELRAMAKEHEKELSGLEPVQISKDEIVDKRLPGSGNNAITKIAPAPRAA